MARWRRIFACLRTLFANQRAEDGLAREVAFRTVCVLLTVAGSPAALIRACIAGFIDPAQVLRTE